ncbi:YdiU family protein [Nereida sp. MMG025]|uniref:protein adenylyltransferase SelO n=1 Tax=Nereida sp. MMG025 TaxID=2909981 RepID=UPI001F216C6B|nr:YdiU family protein [Nereida sp. MMG025]MCF6443459.1 YdiU family protein [Nereida sp. MMG025]
MTIAFDNSYARLPHAMFARVQPTEVPAPHVLAWNQPLADDLKIDLQDTDKARYFSGNALPDGADPIAQVYAGHQFGNWNPRLGDGRAILLGEVLDRSGARHDIQLKGAGRTPYSRGGDGRAWLGPVLREYVVSEAMNALGVPTTRALAAVGTGAPVLREQGPLPGAVLTRVATSHIRVGTFQYFASVGDTDSLRALLEHTSARHYPTANSPKDFLAHVVRAQAELVAKWLSLGFIHGVMNTDNAHVGGLTIDYGPCAFMDAFHPMQVYSSIDHTGRYAYGNQPNIAAWNCAQLATALLPLEADRDAAVATFTEVVHGFGPIFEAAYDRIFLRKIGITTPQDGDMDLLNDLMKQMALAEADFTNTFRNLAQAPFPDWQAEWAARIAKEPDPEAVMQAINPAIIPRNHRIEQMIDAAVAGDMAPFERLHTALANPFAQRDDDLTAPPRPEEVVQATFCGT